jgi:hypothetical protein
MPLAKAASNLGEASIKITADTTELRSGLTSAEQQTRTALGGMGKATDNFGSSVERATGKVREFTQRLTRIVSTATAAAGAILAVANSIGAVADFVQAKFGSGRSKAEDFIFSLGTAGRKSAAELEELAKQIATVEAELEYKLRRPIAGSFVGRGTAQIKEELASLRVSQAIALRLSAKDTAAARAQANDEAMNEDLLREQERFDYIRSEQERDRKEAMQRREENMRLIMDGLEEEKKVREEINRIMLDGAEEYVRTLIRGLNEAADIAAGFNQTNLGFAAGSGSIDAIRAEVRRISNRIGRN